MGLIEEQLTEKIIVSAIEVHNYWGPGLLESILTDCRVGLLINYNEPMLKQGIERLVL